MGSREHIFRMELATRVRAIGPGPVPAGDACAQQGQAQYPPATLLRFGKAASASESGATMAPNEQVTTPLPSGVAKRANETLKTV